MSLSLGQPLMTTKQVARRLQISKRTLYRWVLLGWIPRPYYPAPRAPRWQESDVVAVIERRRAVAEAAAEAAASALGAGPSADAGETGHSREPT